MESVGGEGLLDGENVHDLAEAVYQARRLTSKMQDDIKVYNLLIFEFSDKIKVVNKILFQ